MFLPILEQEMDYIKACFIKFTSYMVQIPQKPLSFDPTLIIVCFSSFNTHAQNKREKMVAQ